MNESTASSSSRWRYGLRYKVALLFGVPVLVIAVLIMFNHYTRERRALEEQARIASIQMSSIILASMKHTMMVNDHSMMENILTGASKEGNITRIWIIDNAGTVQLSSIPAELKTKVNTQSMGCVECHQYPPASRPRVQRVSASPSTVRVITPIDNETQCTGCHSEKEKHLGVLLTDISMVENENLLLSNLRENIILTLILTVLAVLAALGMANWLVVRRVEVMQHAVDAFEKGDYSARIKHNWRTGDEITKLADSFNRMATSIARNHEEQKKITQVRQQAIMDERERIARELHDGVAQFLGYINTKIIAISTLIKADKNETAQKHIDQIMHAVHDQSVDVRASIVGLKLAEHGGENLVSSLQEYIRQCNVLLDLPIDLVVEPEVEKIRLNPEVELHLVRIVQEAISNIRKHAQASRAQVRLSVVDDALVITIQDDGVGFNPWQLNGDYQPHFGLQTMRERAELAGAQFSLVSEPGIGTTVTLRLPLEAT